MTTGTGSKPQDEPGIVDLSRVSMMPRRQPRKPRASKQAGADRKQAEHAEPTPAPTPPTYQQGQSVVERLEADPKPYMVNQREPGTAWVDMVHLPGYLQTTAEKLKGQILRPRPIGLNPTLCCCLGIGLEIVSQNPAVAALYSARRRFDTEPQQGTAKEEFVAQYFRSGLTLDLERGKRHNLPVPSDLKDRLAGLAISLGLDQGGLAVLCIMACLATQDEVPQSYRDRMTAKLRSAYELIEMKTLGAEALMASLYGGGWKA